MMLFITGANGAGKTTCIPMLRTLLPKWEFFDFDDAPTDRADLQKWRQATAEYWLTVGVERQANGIDVVVSGHAIPGEVLAAPSAVLVEGLAFCLLDCCDVERLARLRQRGRGDDTQDTFNWAAWQRLHVYDPQWRQDILMENATAGMRWERWSSWTADDARWDVYVCDTSGRDERSVARELAGWALEQRAAFDGGVLPLRGHWWE